MADTTTLVTDLIRTSVDTAALTADMMTRLPQSPKQLLLDPYLYTFGSYEITRGPTGTIDSTCVTPEIPEMPEEPLLGSVSPADIPMAPVFAAAPPAMDLDIAKPDSFVGSVPAAPTLSPVTIPDDPSLVIPDAPSMLAIVLPAVPTLNLPTFSAIAPNAPGDTALQFGWNEESYQSDLMTLLQQRASDLIESFNGGYDPEIESAIWDKSRGESAAKLVGDIEVARRRLGARGLPRPPGFLAHEIVLMQANRKGEVGESSRRVSIAQSDLEQTTRQLAFQTMAVLEQSLVSYASRSAQRSLEVAKFMQSAAIDIYDAMVGRLQAEVQAVSAKAEAFRARVAAEVSKLEIYKAELDAQRLVGKINVDMLEAYKAELEGLMARVLLHHEQVRAVQAKIESATSFIAVYGQRVRAYGSQVDAKAAEYKGYAAKIKGEVAKVGILKAEAEAYSNMAAANEAGTKAARDQALLEYKSKHQLPLKAYRARLTG